MPAGVPGKVSGNLLTGVPLKLARKPPTGIPAKLTTKMLAGMPMRPTRQCVLLGLLNRNHREAASWAESYSLAATA